MQCGKFSTRIKTDAQLEMKRSLFHSNVLPLKQAMQPGIAYVRVSSIKKETDKVDREKESQTEDRITRTGNRGTMKDVSV